MISFKKQNILILMMSELLILLLFFPFVSLIKMSEPKSQMVVIIFLPDHLVLMFILI